MGIKPFRAQISVQKNLSKRSIVLEFYRKISQTDSVMQKNINNNFKKSDVDIKRNKSSS